MFVGRKKELGLLKSQFKSANKSAILVYGKRRVGKSSLIANAAKDFDGIAINHLCVKTTYEGNLSLLCRSVCSALELPLASFNTIFDLFDFLKAQNKKILLVLDEYQYLKQSLKDSSIDSYMQSIIDSLAPNIKLVLCGSYISIMKELVTESNPLFGRFTLIINLQEFDYLDASEFYKSLSNSDKVAFYSVFGGSPYVLSILDEKKSLRQNIVELLIPQNSVLRTYIENVMLSEIRQAYDIRLFEVLGNGKKRYSEIASSLGVSDNGLLDKQLKYLISMEAIQKVFPINRPKDKKRQFYQIKDNLMRFYFSYIFGNESLISKFGEERFYRLSIDESLNTFISYRFEEIVCQYFSRLARNGARDDILDVGSYWYDDNKNKRNGQFDCVLRTDSGYDFYEAKFYKKKMSLKECKNEEAQIRNVAELDCDKIGFVCSSGFNFESKDFELLNAEDIYFMP